MSFRTLLLILFLLFNTFPKCFTNTLALSSSVLARSPDGRLIWNSFGYVWRDFSPLQRIHMFSHTLFWLNDILWIVSARCLDHLDLAISIISSTSCWSVLRFINVSCEGVCWSDLMLWIIVFLAANAGLSVLLLWWNHPLLHFLFIITDCWALFMMASLKSVY